MLASGRDQPEDGVPGHEPAAPAIGRRESRLVRAGFIPLLDVAVLVAAREGGFAAREGLDLALMRDVSWANIRDRLAFHQFDVAHMLAPMTVAAQVGLGSNPSPTITPFSLGRGGNAVTLSRTLYEAMEAAAGLAEEADALAAAKALKAVVEARRARGARPLVFGMTYPFSSHNYELRYWMAAGGVDPDRDVTMTVVPPPLTADAMTAGAIDGFCVNAPWNMMAVARGIGRVVAVKADIWPDAPEKVLGMRADWAEANRDTLARLLVALDAAAAWCDRPDNRPELAGMMTEGGHVDAPRALAAALLAGEFQVAPSGRRRIIPDYLTFHRGGATLPRIEEALWSFSQMVRWGQAALTEANIVRARSAYRADLYHAALPGRDPAGPPGAPFIDGRAFTPGALGAYVDGFEIARRAARATSAQLAEISSGDRAD